MDKYNQPARTASRPTSSRQGDRVGSAGWAPTSASTAAAARPARSPASPEPARQRVGSGKADRHDPADRQGGAAKATTATTTPSFPSTITRGVQHDQARRLRSDGHSGCPRGVRAHDRHRVHGGGARPASAVEIASCSACLLGTPSSTVASIRRQGGTVALSAGAQAFITRMNKTLKEELLVSGRPVSHPHAVHHRLPSDRRHPRRRLAGQPVGRDRRQESAGKTFLALKSIAANQALDPRSPRCGSAAEHYNTEWAEALGVDNTRVVAVPTQKMEKGSPGDAGGHRQPGVRLHRARQLPGHAGRRRGREGHGRVHHGGRGARPWASGSARLARRPGAPYDGIGPAVLRADHQPVARQDRRLRPVRHPADVTWRQRQGLLLLLPGRGQPQGVDHREAAGHQGPGGCRPDQHVKTIKNKTAAPQQKIELDLYFRRAPSLGLRPGRLRPGQAVLRDGEAAAGLRAGGCRTTGSAASRWQRRGQDARRRSARTHTSRRRSGPRCWRRRPTPARLGHGQTLMELPAAAGPQAGRAPVGPGSTVAVLVPASGSGTQGRRLHRRPSCSSSSTPSSRLPAGAGRLARACSAALLVGQASGVGDRVHADPTGASPSMWWCWTGTTTWPCATSWPICAGASRGWTK